MRVCFVLLVAAAVLVGSSDATSTTNGIAASRLSPADSLGQFVHQRRLLRAYEVEDEGEERVDTAEINKWISQLLNREKNLLTSVDDVASHLGHADLKRIEKKLANKEHEVMKDLVEEGWTPQKLFKNLNIEEKLLSKTPKDLDLDDNYKLYLAFDEYWNHNVNWLKKLLRSR
ncbi:hypothetical protein PF008_g8404 [Phytophthora fragariae]|uniref:RxLR effector protein n=1 Tax=Phytophthora fragariae TaxID=53985 RepID=A0A6G0S1B4_9STRA|nr:hypothetical protein PF008_g8404 [Phytophthora fragariae]